MPHALPGTAASNSPLRLTGVFLLLLLISAPLGAAEDPGDSGIFGDLPVVLSATRLRQSVRDAPVSMTVIDRELIEASGFTEIPDLMRLVPGFVVDYDSGHLPVTGYHMLHDRYVRHQQVLIDGRSVYTPILGGVPWVDLPITMDDIDRIEVVRGPNAASYGSNSFLGVINIITRDSALDRGTRVKVNSGDNGLQEGFLRHGNSLGDMDYVFSMAYRQDWGFEERHDDKRVKMVTFRGDYQIDNNDSVIFQAGYNGGIREEDNTIDLSVPDYQRKVNSQYQQIRWIRALDNYSELRLQYYHTALNEQKSYTGSDESFFTERHDLELQHTFNASENLRIVWGGSYRRDHSKSQYWLASEAPEYINIGRLFFNAEYLYSSKLTLNAGVMIEDNDLSGIDRLPRAGINYHITPYDTVRLSVSRANREPVTVEEYPGADNAFYYLNDVKPEYVTAYELGYLTETRDKRISADIKYYYEDISGLIIYDYGGPYGPWFNNFDDMSIHGVEAQLTLRPSARSRVHIAYAHSDIDSTANTVNSEYDIAAPTNSLSVLGIWQFDNELTGSLGFYHKTPHKQLAKHSYDPPRYEHYQRVDARLARKSKLFGRNQEMAVTVQNVFDEDQESRLENFPDRRFYITYKLEFD